MSKKLPRLARERISYRRIKTGDFLRILWGDACSVLGWYDLKHKEPDTAYINHAGWVVAKTDESLTLSMAVSEYKNSCDPFTIPASNIRRIVRIDGMCFDIEQGPPNDIL